MKNWRGAKSEYSSVPIDSWKEKISEHVLPSDEQDSHRELSNLGGLIYHCDGETRSRSN